MKLKRNLILDAAMFAVIWIVMEYRLTGNLLHEILGIVLIAGFLVHMILHRNYYGKPGTILGSGNGKNIAALVLNLVLAIASVIMLASSVMISRSLFSFLGIEGNYFVWRTIHVVCAVTILVCMVIHLFLHYRMFAGLFRKKFESRAVQNVGKIGAAIVSLAVVVAVARTGYTQLSSTLFPKHQDFSDTAESIAQTETNEFSEEENPVSDQDKKTSAPPQKIDDKEVASEEEQNEITAKPEDETDTEIVEDDSESSTVLTLQEYLQSLHCNGCGKRCSLASPRCGRGEANAQTATVEYNSTYGTEE